MRFKNLLARGFVFGLLMASLAGPFHTKYVAYAEETITVKPFAEQTVWYLRDVDGKAQRRLWSLTYGKWLTDWEWV